MSDIATLEPATPETANSTESGLLLDSLEIENFRCFRHLVIPKLGRVNLITGKNNVGKSTLLEAIYVACRQNKLQALRSILSYRQEIPGFLPPNSDTLKSELKYEKNFFPYVNNIFYNRIFDGIGEFYVKTSNNKVTFSIFSENIFHEEEKILNAKPNPEFYIAVSSEGKIDGILKIEDFLTNYETREIKLLDSIQFIRLFSPVGSSIDSIWDEISLTGKESVVIRYMKNFIPGIERIGFRNSNYEALRRPYVKLENIDAPVPLRNFGDGAHRIFHIATSLTSCQNGICLIDEIDNGIHYSVLRDVFRFLLTISAKYNIQIICTTHSRECIEAFQEIASSDSDPNSGMLIRLANHDGGIIATNFDEEDLGVMTRRGLEVR
ncbi:MAG: AAA family ATPase [Armatimonas sp.]